MKKSILNLVTILFAKTNLRNMLVLIAAGIVISLNSCGLSDQNTETQALDTVTASDATIFENQEVGWTIDIPISWTKEELKEEDNTPETKVLLMLFNSENNMFIATAGNIGIGNDEAFEKSHLKNIETYFSGLKKRGLKWDHLTNSADTINGQYFVVYEFTVNNANGSYAMNQKIYAAYINGFDFMTTLFYTNEVAKATLIQMMDSSKFKTINK